MSEFNLTAESLAAVTRTMQAKPYYQIQMALTAASGGSELDLPAYMVNEEAVNTLKAMGCKTDRAGAFIRVSWLHLLPLALVLMLSLTSCEAKQEPPAPVAPQVVMVGTTAEGEGFTITQPVASDEDPLTDAQREAIAMTEREQPTIEEAFDTGAWALRTIKGAAWILAVFLVAGLVWVLLDCGPAAAAGDDADRDYDDAAFEREALRDSARERRDPRWLHIKRA